MEVTLGSGDKFYYVPVLESLERLLNDEFVLAEVKFHLLCTCTMFTMCLTNGISYIVISSDMSTNSGRGFIYVL